MLAAVESIAVALICPARLYLADQSRRIKGVLVAGQLRPDTSWGTANARPVSGPAPRESGLKFKAPIAPDRADVLE